MRPPQASIVITTRNRREDLEKAIGSCLKQNGQPEVIVIDDGSTDGTSVMVRSKFPQVVLHREENTKGLIVQRNRGARLATAPVIFSIDDDAIFSSPTIVEMILPEFNDPAIGAVAIPFVDVCKDLSLIRQEAPFDSGDFVCSSYIGTAHALRKDVFLCLEGYREQLFHQGEESDYCLRMLNAGYVVKLGRSDAIHHFESPRRDFSRMDIYGRRNNILFGWHNAPAVSLPIYLLATSFNGIRHGLRVRRVQQMLVGLASGYRAIAVEWRNRTPVSRSTYRLYRWLVKKGPLPAKKVLQAMKNSKTNVATL